MLAMVLDCLFKTLVTLLFPLLTELSNSSVFFNVPSITKPLLSVQKFSHDNNVFFEFHVHRFFVKDPTTKKVLLFGQSENGFYTLLLKLSSSFRPSVYFSAKAS
ncbi:hypothetical protein RDI58_014758 [Solanum bulbocastanum]|uniref:Uncharacterized protein n=1 Tax=Solanum bulbocastanum TaxID=147425 RepID=A0AAN8TK88_SOLBU